MMSALIPLVELKAFRQLAANLDSQLIDQVVDEHNRRLRGSVGIKSEGMETVERELQQCQAPCVFPASFGTVLAHL